MHEQRSNLVLIGVNERRISAQPDPSQGRRAGWLAAFLSGDLQASAEGTRYLLAVLDDLESGIDRTETFGGNAINLILRRTGAQLQHTIFDDQPNEGYTLAEIRDALEDWSTAIQRYRQTRRLD